MSLSDERYKEMEKSFDRMLRMARLGEWLVELWGVDTTTSAKNAAQVSHDLYEEIVGLMGTGEIEKIMDALTDWEGFHRDMINMTCKGNSKDMFEEIKRWRDACDLDGLDWAKHEQKIENTISAARTLEDQAIELRKLAEELAVNG